MTQSVIRTNAIVGNPGSATAGALAPGCSFRTCMPSRGVQADAGPESAMAAPKTGFAGTAGGTERKKPPSRCYLKGGVNPAATYSPGPEGQVPSAI